MKLRSYTPSATQGAINAVAAFGRARTTNTTARISPMSCGTYDGSELAPCQDRPSAMQASTLPSRRGNHLRWPDGRWTDLHGTPAVEPESTHTMPRLLPLNPQPTRAPRTAAALCLRLPTTQPLKPASKSTKYQAWAAEKAEEVPMRRNTKLKEHDVRAIRRMYASGVNRATIAEKYGISIGTVTNITLRKTWADVK